MLVNSSCRRTLLCDGWLVNVAAGVLNYARGRAKRDFDSMKAVSGYIWQLNNRRTTQGYLNLELYSVHVDLFLLIFLSAVSGVRSLQRITQAMIVMFVSLVGSSSLLKASVWQ